MPNNLTEQITLATIIFQGYENLIAYPAANVEKWKNYGDFNYCQMCKLNQVNSSLDYANCKTCIFWPCLDLSFYEFYQALKYVFSPLFDVPGLGQNYQLLINAANRRLAYLKQIMEKNVGASNGI